MLTGDSSSERRVQRVMSALSPLIPPLDGNGLRALRYIILLACCVIL